MGIQFMCFFFVFDRRIKKTPRGRGRGLQMTCSGMHLSCYGLKVNEATLCSGPPRLLSREKNSIILLCDKFFLYDC